MELYPIWDPKSYGPSGYIIIEEIPIPSMCAEFDPGPPDDFPFPEFWDTSLTVAIVDIHESTSRQIGADEMKENYRFIRGRAERIAYWRVMKYFEHIERNTIEIEEAA